MKSTESIESRKKRVEMHDYFLNRIDESINNKHYIEATWLIYSCFENRYFRTLLKYRSECKYCKSNSKCNKNNKNKLALSTKINCVKRLHNEGVSCIKNSFDSSIYEETLNWVKNRNVLMHELLSLEYYENTDKEFKESAEKGRELLLKTYQCCTKFRSLFYAEGYKFVMPEKAMEGCSCKPKGKDKRI